MASSHDITEDKAGVRCFYWGVIAGMALVFMLVMGGVADYYNYYLPEKNIELLAPIKARKNSENDITVVMLGNSRLRHAVTFGFDPEKPVELKDGRKIWGVQFAQDVAMFSSYKDLWPEIIAAKPDVLVIQNFLITNENKLTVMSLEGFSNMIYTWAERRVQHIDPDEQWIRDRYDIIDHCIKPDAYNSAEMQDRIIFTAYRDNHNLNPDNENMNNIREAIVDALNAGILVAIADFPANEKMVEEFGVPLHVVDYYGLGRMPKREELLPDLHDKVIWLEFDGLFQDTDLFCDFAHFNEKGREKYTAFFIEFLGLADNVIN